MLTKPNWVRSICIGKGSFGTVHLAIPNSNSNPNLFAVKSVTTHNAHHTQLGSLENEIRILKSLNSDYIVRYLSDDTTSENSTQYRNLHMEYMPNGTIADLDRQSVNQITVRSYTRCIVSALSYIHGKNIVHCDVKGRNVLIGSGFGVAKLADFGSAMELQLKDLHLQLDSSTTVMTRGSPLWMAPEVVRGEYQGPESDVWSLGCTVVEMVTGKPAWQDRGIDSLWQIGFSDELPELPGHISGELHDFLSKCLRRNRSERWSCDQLLQHPFLLSTHSNSNSNSAPSDFAEKKSSPRCVFDWSDLNLSDDNMSEIANSNSVASSIANSIENLNANSNLSSLSAKQRISGLCSNSGANWESDGWELNFSDDNMSKISNSNSIANSNANSDANSNSSSLSAKQRISGLCSNSGANWESDGWEIVRNAGCNAGEEMSESGVADGGETAVNWPEYSGDNDEEGTGEISRSERTNGGHGNDEECTNEEAEGTSDRWNSRDTDHNDSCCVCVWLNKLLWFNRDGSDIFINKFCWCFKFGPVFELFLPVIFMVVTSS